MSKKAISTLSRMKIDWYANGRDSFSLGFRALAVHRIAELGLRLNNKILRFLVWRVYWFFQRHCRNRGIEIHPLTKIGLNVNICHQGGIVFHPAAVIEDGCRIRHGVTLGAASSRRSQQAPHLEKNVDIGVGAAILGGITVGEGTRIGANVVLTESVAAGSIVMVEKPLVINNQ